MFVSVADKVVENYVGKLEKWGLGYDALRKDNERYAWLTEVYMAHTGAGSLTLGCEC
jgi:crotonobetainyl-CoA:carnitine CoA-transferase CaiB-like acyl-CoA transferase